MLPNAKGVGWKSGDCAKSREGTLFGGVNHLLSTAVGSIVTLPGAVLKNPVVRSSPVATVWVLMINGTVSVKIVVARFRGHVPYCAVAVFTVVPVDEACDPPFGGGDVGDPISRYFQPNYVGQRTDVAVRPSRCCHDRSGMQPLSRTVY